jgi:hypothetical protein
MPRNKSGSANGGIIGKVNVSSFGNNTITEKKSSGTLTIQPGTRIIDATIVAGGGSGGRADIGGGAGAGGVLCQTSIPVSSPFEITIGGGGNSINSPTLSQGNTGTNSTLVVGSTTYTANGGGSGGGASSFVPSPGGAGGSGGGAGNAGGCGGAGVCGQGNNGAPRGAGNGGGGGGGAGSAGSSNPGSGSNGGAGGNGKDVSPLYPGASLTNSGVFAGGGGGSGDGPGGGAGGAGGPGGGGVGSGPSTPTAGSGTTNTGGGGGAGENTRGNSGAGGSGTVVVKELNKASGVWSMQSQFQARIANTWPS